jgi:polyferredoxin
MISNAILAPSLDFFRMFLSVFGIFQRYGPAWCNWVCDLHILNSMQSGRDLGDFFIAAAYAAQ